ncbi:MAG TPA: glycoside hydrolase family 30 beta sandwich domain-containing protein [Gemmatimonadaceae bacterium]|nr:glycoside hydrolase family 30 beta sandwich domain-containing protein [Gemmatimonadaceae bacterium]
MLLLTAVAGCSTAATAGTTPPRPPPSDTGLPVQTWLTTADQRKGLSHEPDLRLHTDSAPALPTIDVDEHTVYQKMLGFGAAFTDASAYLIQEKMSAAQREALLQDLFARPNGIGLSFMRVPMGASDFSLRQYSYDDMPAGQTDSTLAHFSIEPDRRDKLPLIKRALAIDPQLTIMASPWSPPGWMKATGSLIQGTLRPEFYDSFADYFVRFIQAYAAEGVRVHAITVQNEPNFEPGDYPGMRLEAPARAPVIGDHVGPRLAAAGLSTVIWDWDHNWDVPQSPEIVLGDSAANRYVQGVAWHCYAGDVSAQGLVHRDYPDKDTYFSECSGGEWAPNYADNLKFFVGTLIIGSTRNWARGVALWNLALDENHGPHTGGCGDCRGVVTITSATGAYTRNVEYFALGHASRFVRPGASRIASTSDLQGLTSVAFRNADDGSKVLIVLNGATQDRTFSVRCSGKSFRYTLPAGAVVTFAWGG